VTDGGIMENAYMQLELKEQKILLFLKMDLTSENRGMAHVIYISTF
jgi:hypothetical protein